MMDLFSLPRGQVPLVSASMPITVTDAAASATLASRPLSRASSSFYPSVLSILDTPENVPVCLESLSTARREEEDWAWSGLTEEEGEDHSNSVLVPDGPKNDSSVATDDQMKQPKTKATIGLLSTLITYVSLNSWYKATHPNAFVHFSEDREEKEWLATSKSWVDRKACRWLSVCGGSHLHLAGARYGKKVTHKTSTVPTSPLGDGGDWDWQNAWADGSDRPEDWTQDEQVLREIPDYVLEYAPLVHLFSGEQFWPCDLAEHLYHTTPSLNYTPVRAESRSPTLNNLDDLNGLDPRWVFLTSDDNVEERPEWLEGEKNIPLDPSDPDDAFEDNDGWIRHPGRTFTQGLKDVADDIMEWFGAGHSFANSKDLEESQNAAQRASGRLKQQAERLLHVELKKRRVRHHASTDKVERIRGGRSDAPAVLVTVNKGHGVVDAFWFFFYSFNLGNFVFNVGFGNHVGDWEHTCIRFHNGEPKAVFFSEHNFGSAYSYDAVEKIGRRPVIYSATGTHAMYPTSGLHPYVLPWGILHDQTDRGPLWDPALNSHSFTYDYKNDTLRSSNLTPAAPTGWFHYAGHWGDKFYPLGDKRQYRFAGQYHYVNGPLGPKFKNLGRKKVCGGPDTAACVIKHWLGGENLIPRWQTTPNADDTE